MLTSLVTPPPLLRSIHYEISGYKGPANGYDSPRAIAVDRSGNVFVTEGSYTTTAYSGAGAPLWTNRYDDPGGGDDRARSTAVDSSGNVFVTSYSCNGTNCNYVTIKFSSSVPPPRLVFQKLNNQLMLSWTNAGFNLQTAPAVTGPFTNLPAATSPHTNVPSARQQFFRLAAP